MKKTDRDTSLFNPEENSSKGFDVDNIKTTNINILLNRVKLDQKKNFNKKLLFSTGIVLTISLIAVFVII